VNRFIIYLSGFLGILLLTLYTLGLFAEKSYNTFILTAAIILIIFIFIPMIWFERYKQNRMIDEIIRSQKMTKKEKINHSNETGKKVKGWSMNNSPFRDRKSGTTWSGGNIHGSIPKRGSRKGLFRN
jgi:predicted membrane protein